MRNATINARSKKDPTFAQSISALLILLVFIGVGYLGFRLRVELLMIAAAACVTIMAMRNGYTWEEMENAIAHKLGRTTPTLLIIWTIGIVISTFIFSGSIPMLIYYGIVYVNPKFVLAAAMLACIVFSIVTGTSWGSAGTVGVAFMGIAMALEVPLHITAGAVICGATFGDKLSPLSETTNLAALTAGANLYDHIRSMFWTTVPPTIIALIVFFVVGNSLNIEVDVMPESALEMVNQLQNVFTWSVWPLIPFLIILIGALMKKPPVPTMLLGSFVAILVGVFCQGFAMYDGVNAALNGFNSTMIHDSGFLGKAANTLLNRGGIKSMVSVIVVIYCGFCYAAIITKAGFLERAIRPIAEFVKTRLSIMAAALFTEGLLLIFSGSSYPAAIMVPEMFKKLFLKVGMPAKTLSRTLEDVGTLCAAFVPWGSSGAFYITALGVSIYGSEGFAIWYITGYLTPIFSLFYAWLGGKAVYLMNDEEREAALAEYEEEIKTL